MRRSVILSALAALVVALAVPGVASASSRPGFGPG
jgi:hypothetical protein